MAAAAMSPMATTLPVFTTWSRGEERPKAQSPKERQGGGRRAKGSMGAWGNSENHWTRRHGDAETRRKSGIDKTEPAPEPESEPE